jgi:hypothetical protein
VARLIWLILMLGFAAVVATGASWVAASSSIGTLLGSPPPRMGSQITTIQWHGLAQVLEQPPTWRFAYGPTAIPGATRVTIEVDPWGKIISTDPPDLEDRLKAFHNTGY